MLKVSYNTGLPHAACAWATSMFSLLFTAGIGTCLRCSCVRVCSENMLFWPGPHSVIVCLCRPNPRLTCPPSLQLSRVAGRTGFRNVLVVVYLQASTIMYVSVCVCVCVCVCRGNGAVMLQPKPTIFLQGCLHKPLSVSCYIGLSGAALSWPTLMSLLLFTTGAGPVCACARVCVLGFV